MTTIPEQRDPQQPTELTRHEVAAWPTATYPDTGTFGYPNGPLPANVESADPSGPKPPLITSLDPGTAVVGGEDITLRVLGAYFDQTSVVVFNGSDEPTTFVAAYEITAIVQPSTASGPMTVPVAVRNDTLLSEDVAFSFTEPPEVGPATGATAGTPGTWTPEGATPPRNYSDLRAGVPVEVVASPTTAWQTGEYVITGDPNTPTNAYWDGTQWRSGTAT